MTLPDAHTTKYYVTTYRHALSERQQWHRFFERATFGLGPYMFDNDLGYVDAQGLPKPHESFGDWEAGREGAALEHAGGGWRAGRQSGTPEYAGQHHHL